MPENPPSTADTAQLPNGSDDENGNYVPDREKENKIFSGVFYHIITGPSLSQSLADELRPILNQNGGTELEPTAGTTKIDFEAATHIISADINFSGYREAENFMIPIVKPEWVGACIERSRLAQVRPYNPDPRFFFSGVVATIAELPVGDKEAICGGIIAMGGQCTHALNKFTTHLVALNMDSEKCKMAIAKNLKVKIVLPHWFDDCLKLERRIDEAPYLLPNPEIERVGHNETLDLPKGPDLSYSHSHPTICADRKPPSLPKEGIDILNKKSIYFGQDLELSDRMKRVLKELVAQSGGSTTDDLEVADVYLGHFREGEEYLRAHSRGIYVANLTWLYWMFAHREWTNPLTRLLHYPIPRVGLPEMKNCTITVSNYGGDARLYLESLIDALGATFTKSMKVDNTHLVTARAHSDKWNAAKEWNINTVNHLWLEETYAKWKVQTLTNSRYTHFPLRTNLMEIVGQTPLDQEALEQFYTAPEDAMDVDDDDDGDSPLSDMESSPAPVTSKKTTAKAAPTKKANKKATAEPSMEKPTRAKSVQTPARRTTTVSTDPSGPPSTGGRRAKQAAAQLLQDQSVDIALYQKEQKRKGGVVGSGRKRRSSVSTVDDKASKKRTASPEDGAEDAKKAKKRPKPTVFLLITAHKRWAEAPQKEEAEKKLLLDIGIKCVAEPDKCTHLAAPQLIRTEKFCRALARAPVVVSISWVDACIKAERIVETDKYLLKDTEGEKRHSVDLQTSLERAKQNKGKLLQGQAVYCTPGVHGGFEVCKRITEANGGVCIAMTAKVTKKPANAPSCEHMVLLSGETAGDKALWPLFGRLAHGQGSKALIYKGDWLLDLALQQKIEWADKYLVKK